MPVAAREKLNVLVSTVITLLETRPEGGGAAGANVPEYFALSSRERVSPAGKELLSVLTKDIGHSQPIFGHTCGG
jgi:hypothetical protein